jgi:hypothetical protein
LRRGKSAIWIGGTAKRVSPKASDTRALDAKPGKKTREA